MNKFDLVILIPLVWGLYRGFRKGFVIEAASLVSLLLATWGGIKFSRYMSELLTVEYGFETQYLPVISFLIIFLGTIIIVFLFARLLERFLKLTMMSTLNKISGAVFCSLKYALIVSILLFTLNAFTEENSIIPEEIKADSYFYPVLSAIPITLLPALKDQVIDLKENYKTRFEQGDSLIR